MPTDTVGPTPNSRLKQLLPQIKLTLARPSAEGRAPNPKTPLRRGIPRRRGPPFLGPHTPWGTERSQNSREQDLLHRQTPQSSSPVEVAHRCRRTTSTHPAPPDSNGHPRGRHHLATGQPRVQGPVVQSLCTRDRGRALTK
ncbi:hypothetical protein AAFF_G00315890 [Aldrovandia affinis]|uniref:Uncharacterized protein n=1 Tax=Aldrovandia affinis TaxID=143900 RepID=A0AAD7SMV8_9TELE|nr:hypothetical protein AAFF_G00315890 [Aldrovandia affinis]